MTADAWTHPYGRELAAYPLRRAARAQVLARRRPDRQRLRRPQPRLLVPADGGLRRMTACADELQAVSDSLFTGRSTTRPCKCELGSIAVKVASGWSWSTRSRWRTRRGPNLLAASPLRAILLTNGNHVREAEALREKYQVPIVTSVGRAQGGRAARARRHAAGKRADLRRVGHLRFPARRRARPRSISPMACWRWATR